MSVSYFSKRLILRPKEELEEVVRSHWIVKLRQIIIALILILGAFFLMFPLFKLGTLGVCLFIALLLTGIIYASREFLIWYFNVFIITTQRIIDIDRRGFFQKLVSELPLSKVRDVSYSVNGVSQAMFKLGDIKVQADLIGGGLALYLSDVKNPETVNRLITELVKDESGRTVEVKKVATLEEPSKQVEKEQAAKEFFSEPTDEEYEKELAQYKDYKLTELIEEYKETFGEAELKKLLVDELDTAEK